jgi:hypothetical protein
MEPVPDESRIAASAQLGLPKLGFLQVGILFAPKNRTAALKFQHPRIEVRLINLHSQPNNLV